MVVLCRSYAELIDVDINFVAICQLTCVHTNLVKVPKGNNSGWLVQLQCSSISSPYHVPVKQTYIQPQLYIKLSHVQSQPFEGKTIRQNKPQTAPALISIRFLGSLPCLARENLLKHGTLLLVLCNRS